MAAFSRYTNISSVAVLKELGVTEESGLSEARVRERRVRDGYNELRAHTVTWFQILKRQFTSPFIYLLLLAAVVAFLLQEMIDGAMIVLFVLINTGIGFYQEFHSEKTLKLLKQYLIKRARVIREGKEILIPSRELVVGDLLVLEPGDIVSADCRLVAENNCVINESALTGESVPVGKGIATLAAPVEEIFKAVNICFSGTTMVSGKGVGVVVATGNRTVIGEVGTLTAETERVSSLTKSLGRFSTFILRLVLVTLAFVFVVNILMKGPRANIPDLLIFSIALAVSVIPEALPVVTTFSLSRGALRLSKHHVVVKRLAAIEDLGSIEVLCTDKTGTLTENTLSVADVFADSAARPIFYAALGAPFLSEKDPEPNNAFDSALWHKVSQHEKEELGTFHRIAELPFDPERRRNSVVVERSGSRHLIVRGAAEDVLRLCTKHPARDAMLHWLITAGRHGQRVIAVARKTWTKKDTDEIAAEERDMQFVGLISFIDPLKKTSKDAVRKAERLGVTVKIITGDSKEVAGAVAHEVGIVDDPEQVITGSELQALGAAEQRKAVSTYDVFARVSPQQKYTIIQLLQEKFEVGFLGEGINDAPALKIANVGLVVQGAADIAQEATDIVLLKKSLQVVVDGIQEGRSAFVNTVKYIKATLASNFGNFYAVAIASLMIDFLPMLPLQILMVNLLSDFPMIAIATDTVDRTELQRPKSYNVREIVIAATVLGIVSTVFDFIMFGLFYRISPGVLQTNWFIGSILTELVFLFSIRTRLSVFKAKRPSATVLWLSLAAFVTTIVLPLTAVGQKVFHFVQPTPLYIVMILTVVVVYFVVTETVKRVYYRMTSGQQNTLS